MSKEWKMLPLNEVSQLGSGNGALQEAHYYKNGRFPFIRTSDVGKIRRGVIHDSADHLNEAGAKKMKLFPKGTVLFPKSGASTFLNHRVMMGIDGYVSSHLATIKANNDLLEDKYLLHYLTTIDARDLIPDIAYPSLTISELGNVEIPVPPKAIQKHIVELLDLAFEAIDTAKANFRKNSENARALFESHLGQIFSNGEWEEKTLGEVCEFQNGQAHEKQIDEKGKYILVNSRFVSSGGEDFKRTSSALSPLHKGDIVLVMSDVPNGKTLAKCFLIDRNNTYSLNQRICVIRSTSFNKKFLYYQLNRHRHLLAFNNGENQTNLRKNDILTTPLYLPSMAVQDEVVEQLDRMAEDSARLEEVYAKKLASLEELKNTILKKAFSGALTPAAKKASR